MALPVVAGAVVKTVGKASVKKAIGAVAVKSVKSQADDIIRSGMNYINTKLSGYDVKLKDVKEAIADYERGRTRYTKADVERLKRIFNRSRLRSNSYKKASRTDVIDVQTVRSEEGNYVLDYTDTVSVSERVTAAQKENDVLAKKYADMINEEARGWQSKLNEELSEQFLELVKGIDPRFRSSMETIKNGGDIIDKARIKNISEDDFLSLTDAIERIREFAPLSETSRTELENEIEKQWKRIWDDANLPERPDLGYGIIDHWDAYYMMMNKIKIEDYDSYSEKYIKIAYYENAKPAGRFAEAYNIFVENRDPEYIVEKLRELGRR